MSILGSLLNMMFNAQRFSLGAELDSRPKHLIYLLPLTLGKLTQISFKLNKSLKKILGRPRDKKWGPNIHLKQNASKRPHVD